MSTFIEHGKLFPESQLHLAAREARLSAGISQLRAAYLLKVSQASIAQAETLPEKNLTLLRLKMINTFGEGFQAFGPLYVIKQEALDLDEPHF